MRCALLSLTPCLLRLGLPVPPGFIITTDTCADFFKGSTAMPVHVMDSWASAVEQLEKKTGKVFGITADSPNGEIPLFLSIRSGAAVDMPRYETF